ncbi:unnamed protein product [Rhizophagus irregularis]|nr:unnamed protein product [Rhizophagus irregularis]CAB5215673.1 unnamed protein product [Rhizophagus irregularis]CAB5357666.1 unnamed protein product [Rhizophagus irregularis]
MALPDLTRSRRLQSLSLSDAELVEIRGKNQKLLNNYYYIFNNNLSVIKSTTKNIRRGILENMSIIFRVRPNYFTDI